MLLTSPVDPFKVIDRDTLALLIIQDASAFILNSGCPQFWESGGMGSVTFLDQAKTFDSQRLGWGWRDRDVSHWLRCGRASWTALNPRLALSSTWGQ